MSYKGEKDRNVKIVNSVKLLGIDKSIFYGITLCSPLKVGIISQKIQLFIATAVRTSNPIRKYKLSLHSIICFYARLT
jgi:hypothetical protein